MNNVEEVGKLKNEIRDVNSKVDALGIEHARCPSVLTHAQMYVNTLLLLMIN